MPRHARVAPGGLVYHALNRAVAGLPLFRKEADYAAFERIMIEAHALHPTRILAWCLMRNHWHFVLWPREEGEVTAFLRWLAHTHAMRWHVAHGTVGRGHLYQGRFKSFPVQEDGHVLTVCRYVERNALSARVVRRGGLALGELVGAAERPAGPAIAVERLAGGAACSLAAVGQPAPDGKGARGPADVGCPGPSLWG